MDTFHYELLEWLKLSGEGEKRASHWYRGAGWYMNRRDGSGTVTSCELIAPAESSSAVGALAALNACGGEGWDVAAFIPDIPPAAAPPVVGLLVPLVGRLVDSVIRLTGGIAADDIHTGDFLIVLKRRITT
jgi:hypothetical protein